MGSNMLATETYLVRESGEWTESALRQTARELAARGQNPATDAIRAFINELSQAEAKFKRATVQWMDRFSGPQMHDARKALRSIRAARKWVRLLQGSLPPGEDDLVAFLREYNPARDA